VEKNINRIEDDEAMKPLILFLSGLAIWFVAMVVAFGSLVP